MPSEIVFEDDDFLAFLDIEPKTLGHTILIPKQHCTQLESLSRPLQEKLINLISRRSAELKEKYKYTSTVILINNGEAVEDIKHFHVHIYGWPATEL